MLDFVPLSVDNFERYEADILRSEEVFPEAIRETSSDYLNVLQGDGSIGLVARWGREYAGNAVGFVPGEDDWRELLLAEAGAAESGLVYLFNIVALPGFQGQGVGRSLLEEFMALSLSKGFRKIGGHFRGNGSLANFKRMGGRELAAFDDWFGTGERYLYCELSLI